MNRTQNPATEHRSASSRLSQTRADAIDASKGHRSADLHVRYIIPQERGLGSYLLISVALFTLATCLAALIPPAQKLPPMIEVDLGFDGVENEPPPLGEPDAGAGEERPPEPEAPPTQEETPEETPQPPTLEPEPTPVPEPEPEPEPAMEEAPIPEPKAQFEVPRDEPLPKPAPKPKPKPVAKVPAKPATKPATTQPSANAQPSGSAPTGSGLTTGRAGVRGSPGGQPGGRGGGRGDFTSTPHPQYDATARQRGYAGRGVFMIQYENGRIVSVSVHQSTGVPYLDSRTITWIKTRWRVKSGTSGSASLPITWQLK